jgi:maltose O-acetyltransferase
MAEQKERMLRGDLYEAWDPELVEERRLARLLTERFNATSVDEPELRRELLEELFGHFGEDTVIEPPLRVDYGSHIRIGARSFVNFGAIVLDCAAVTIGDEVQIATNVQLLTATHPLDAATRRAGPELAFPISIGDGAWLGGGVIVCPGVAIGENTVVGAGSVVVKDLPAGVLAVGNPCRPVREL